VKLNIPLIDVIKQFPNTLNSWRSCDYQDSLQAKRLRNGKYG
jgi:hypothetical protein